MCHRDQEIHSSLALMGWLLVLFFLAAIVASGVAMLISWIGVPNPWDNYLRLASQTVLIFGIPSLVLGTIYGYNEIIRAPKIDTTFWKMLLWILVAWLLSLFPVQTLWEINRSVSFPDSLAGIESTLRRVQEENEQFVLNLICNSHLGHLWILIIVVALLPAVFEEWFFRGCLQVFLTKKFEKKWTAIVITAGVFSVFHGEFFSLMPRIFLGLVLGYLYFYTQNLLYPIIMHFVNNLASIVILKATKPENIEELFKVSDIGFWMILSIVGLGIMLAVFKRIKALCSE